jgi:hypothetical protein
MMQLGTVMLMLMVTIGVEVMMVCKFHSFMLYKQHHNNMLPLLLEGFCTYISHTLENLVL